ncbi:MAG: glycosyltransferase family 39 protein [Oscillospiraceae bacterium]|jgi:4-amino-4-deoxy-L-arabinose transferase-like glycosyltransferase|nr:glycosyltransferase family 39 protein [Oscillospiraceae bacterium]
MTTIDAWVFALVLCACLALAFHPRARAYLNGISWLRCLGDGCVRILDRAYWPLFALAMAAGVLLRVWRFPELPQGLYHDEAMTAAQAISLLRNGTDMYGASWPLHLETWKYGQQSALLAYMQVPVFALFGVSRLTLRLPILVLSVIALPVLWHLARRVLGRGYALLALWMLAICPWQVVQSRWALDCNTMPHMLLFSVYFLHLGLDKRPFLYLSMVFFGLTLYAYGVALFAVPVLLLCACAYLLRRRLVRWGEVCICLAVFLAVGGPFLLTMAINAFGWPTVHLGPFTLQNFPKTQRANDMLLYSPDFYKQFVWNLYYWLMSTLGQNEGDTIAAYFASRTLYPFSVPVILAGVYMLWRQKRRIDTCAHLRESIGKNGSPAPGGEALILFWIGAMAFCGILTNYTTSQRSNAIFYPLLLAMCYALYQAVRRVRAAIPVVALVYALGLTVFVHGYFADASYIARTGAVMNADLYGALADVRDMDCDRYYIYTSNTDPEVTLGVEVVAMVAHELDGRQWADETMVQNHLGEDVDYYTNRYEYTAFQDFEPDPMEPAAYVIRQEDKRLFDPEEYIVRDFGLYASAYPRYWAE